MGRILILAPLLAVVSTLIVVVWRGGVRRSWRRLLTHPVTIWAFVLAGTLSALFWWLAVRKVAERCASDGLCGIVVASLGEWGDSGPFRATAETDAACRAALWCSAFSTPTRGEPHRLRFEAPPPAWTVALCSHSR